MSLVSVLIPCYGHQSTLPRALFSLVLQDFAQWEAIVVDDGSEPPIDRERLPSDPRIRLLRLPTNQGRGKASQVALQASVGRYVAFLDADDWYLPDKLSRQVAFLDSNPDVDCVAGTLGCVSRDGGDLREMLGPRPGIHHHTPTGSIRLPFAACLVRGKRARQVGFDPAFRRGQDRDFLHRLLVGRSYAVVPGIEYVYHTGVSFALSSVQEGLRYRLQFYRRHLRNNPGWALLQIGATVARLVLYPIFHRLGRWQGHVERNLRPAPTEVQQQYRAALAALERHL